MIIFFNFFFRSGLPVCLIQACRMDKNWDWDDKVAMSMKLIESMLFSSFCFLLFCFVFLFSSFGGYLCFFFFFFDVFQLTLHSPAICKVIPNDSNFVLLWDMEGLGWSNVDYSILKFAIDLLQNYYPEVSFSFFPLPPLSIFPFFNEYSLMIREWPIHTF